MKFNNFKDYILNKLIFPRTLILDRPGVIINKTISRFGKENARTRIVYTFEDIYSELYQYTLKDLGREKTDLLWYQIGKDVSTRYFTFLRKKKIPDIFILPLLNHILDTLRGAGMSFAKNVEYHKNTGLFIAKGDNNIICRKTGSGYLMSGIVSGLLSSINDRNIEAIPRCSNCPKNCLIISNSKMKDIYVSELNNFNILKNYNKTNFDQNNNINNHLRLYSFTDLLKFGIISLDKKEEKFVIKNRVIIPSEAGLPDIFSYNYQKNNKIELYNKSVCISSEKIAREIFKNVSNNNNKKINEFMNLISAFGFGTPYFRKIGNQIIINFNNPPITGYNPNYLGYVINGFLNEIYSKKFKVKYLSAYKMEFFC